MFYSINVTMIFVSFTATRQKSNRIVIQYFSKTGRSPSRNQTFWSRSQAFQSRSVVKNSESDHLCQREKAKRGKFTALQRWAESENKLRNRIRWLRLRIGFMPISAMLLHTFYYTPYHSYRIRFRLRIQFFPNIQIRMRLRTRKM